jgi:hypothetical protein
MFEYTDQLHRDFVNLLATLRFNALFPSAVRPVPHDQQRSSPQLALDDCDDSLFWQSMADNQSTCSPPPPAHLSFSLQQLFAQATVIANAQNGTIAAVVPVDFDKVDIIVTFRVFVCLSFSLLLG